MLRKVLVFLLASSVAAQSSPQLPVKRDASEVSLPKEPRAELRPVQLTELETITENKRHKDNPLMDFIMGIVLFFSSFVFLFFVEYETCKSAFLLSRARKACQTEVRDLDTGKRCMQLCRCAWIVAQSRVLPGIPHHGGAGRLT